MVDNFTGAGAQNGVTNLAGAKVAISQINSSGGVLGCPLKLSTSDDGSDYTKDLPLLEQALVSHKYAMAWDGDFGCVTTAPLVTRLKALQISGCSSTSFATKANPTIFDVTPIAARSAMIAARYELSKGIKRFALFVDNTAIGQGEDTAMTALVKKAGGTVTDVEQLSLSGIDFSSAIQRAKASNPQVIFTDLFGAAGGHLHQDLATSGWKIPFIGGSNESATALKGLVPLSDLNGGLEVGPATMASPSNAVRTSFISDLKAQGSPINTFLYGFANAHDPLILFAWAANQTGSLNPQTIATKLHNSGNVPVPNLVQGTTTGYTPTCGEWNPLGGFAVMKAGFYNQGRLPLIATETSPPLPPVLQQC
jgi:branched-chain amino acid transport system substrate-binding protein